MLALFLLSSGFTHSASLNLQCSHNIHSIHWQHSILHTHCRIYRTTEPRYLSLVGTYLQLCFDPAFYELDMLPIFMVYTLDSFLLDGLSTA